MSDSCLVESDVLFLTETDADSSINILNLLSEFSIVFNNSNFYHSNLDVALQSNVQVYIHEKSGGISILKFCKPTCSGDVLCVVLIFRSHGSVSSSFYGQVETLNDNKNLNFIIGDFNIDAFNQEVCARVSNIISNFRLLSKTFAI